MSTINVDVYFTIDFVLLWKSYPRCANQDEQKHREEPQSKDRMNEGEIGRYLKDKTMRKENQ